jgi:hypothetical protein
MEKIRFVVQRNFLDKVDLPSPEITGPYDQTIRDFLKFSAGQAMRLIGEIYVPNFQEESHTDFEQSMAWLYLLKLGKERFNGGFKNPEYLDRSANRIQRLLDASEQYGKSEASKDGLVTYSDTSLLEKDLRGVLNPYYKRIRLNRVDVFHKETGELMTNVKKESSSLVVDRVNRMFMSNGRDYYQEGMDRLIGYFFFLYTKTLSRR